MKINFMVIGLICLSLILSISLGATIHHVLGLYEDYHHQIELNSELKEEISELEKMEERILEAMEEEVERQEQRNANIEIEYMKLLSENKENASPVEAMFLNYLEKLYGME